MPAQVVSDNAKTFVSTVQDVLWSPEVQQHFSGMNIQWVFNLESIGKARLSYDNLSTVLAEIEAIINSRPLSYLSTEDLDEQIQYSIDILHITFRNARITYQHVWPSFPYFSKFSQDQ